jgi:DNA polymerase III subunit epsilon
MESTLLRDAEVLLVDCQTTGANPRNGRLLEIAWARFRPRTTAPIKIDSHLLRGPTEETISPHIERLTGISTHDLARAECPSKVSELFLRELRSTTTLVIHFARFELPFLSRLAGWPPENGIPPYDVVCTHEISCRLLPRLPRRGLRAVAGYLGFPVPELKRARHHVEATARVWAWIVAALESRGILSRHDLSQWLASPIPPRDLSREYPMELQVRRDLPSGPGVYRMIAADGTLLYVGKATSLRSRVRSYFAPGARPGDHILEMLSQARRLEVTETGSVLEAALLEADEIQSLDPPYNRALRGRARKLFFASADFEEIVAPVDAAHPVGPFPTEMAPRSFAALLRLLRRTPRPDDVPALFAGKDPVPDAELAAQGVELVAGGLDPRISNGVVILSRLGRACVEAERARRAASAISGVEIAGPSNEIEEWSPESVARYLEKLVTVVFRLHNRARWFRLIADSAFRWSREGETWCRAAIVDGGRVVFEGHRFRTGGLPRPVRRSDLERKRLLDGSTYDRLRVLTTELRGLVRRRHRVEMRLTGSRVLTEKELSWILQWL